MWDLTIHPPWGPASLLARRSVSGSNKYCPLWPVMYRHQPYGFKTCLLGRGFHTLIRKASFPSPTDVGSHKPPPWGPAPSLAHHSVSGSDTICNNPCPPLTDIVRFGPLCIVVSLTILKRICQGEVSTPF